MESMGRALLTRRSGGGGYKKLLPSEYLTSGDIFTKGVPVSSSRTGGTGKNITQTATFNAIKIIGIVGGGRHINDGGGTDGISGAFKMFLTDESGVETQCTYDSTNGWYVPSDTTKKYTAIRCRQEYSSGSAQCLGILCPTSIFYE